MYVNLYNFQDWKDKVDDNKQDRIKSHEMDLELNKERMYTPNINSMMIVKKNNYHNFKKNANRSQDDINVTGNDNEVEFDLWPDIDKTYYKGEVSEDVDANNNHTRNM